MASEEQRGADSSLKLAVAMSLLRSKLAAAPPPPPPPSRSSPDHSTNEWKLKAKKRKQELLRLREDLRLAEDNSNCDLFPKYAACKCYFFDNLGELTSPNRSLNGSDWRFNDVLLRRFLRQVRLNERRRRKDGSRKELWLSDYNSEDETEQLRSSVDFLVELCDSAAPEKIKATQFCNWSHQAVDFILGALKVSMSKGKNMELLVGTTNSLIVRLVRKMCTFSGGDDIYHFDIDTPFYIQHLIRKLGSESFVGQRVILAVSQRISILGESFLFMDPFDDAFPGMHDCLYVMIQLIEFLVSDYLVAWSSSESFDMGLFEEWVKSIVHARKSLQLLETRNGLYVLYMDRVVGHVAKYVGQIPSLRKLNLDVLSNLFS